MSDHKPPFTTSIGDPLADLLDAVDPDDEEPLFLGEAEWGRALARLSWQARQRQRLRAIAARLPRKRGRPPGSGRKLPDETAEHFVRMYLTSARAAGRHWTLPEYAGKLGVDPDTLDAHRKRLGVKGWPPI
jgi:hypothetical protein